ncbi:MAG: hypothetical protein CMH57_00180 [Myxococcales bacterium]|nr:hypothetical protein [Myxococcales bacterium]
MQEQTGWARVWAERARVIWGGVALAGAIDRAARIRGDAVAVEVTEPLSLPGFSMETWSYRDLARFVGRACAVLREAGVVPGERVVIYTGNALNAPLLALAAIRCGAQAVPINHKASADEVSYILRDSGAATLIVDPETVAGAAEAIGEAPAVVRVLVSAGARGGAAQGRDALQGEVAPEVLVIDLAARMLEPLPIGAPAEVSDDAVCAIFYTSGTTGSPKGAMLTSASLMQGAGAIMALPRLRSYRVLIALPAAHIMGFAATLLPILGGVVVRRWARFDAEAIRDELASGEVDAFLGVPSMYQLLVRAGATERELSGVKLFMSAADVMPGELIRDFKRVGRLVSLGPVQIPAAFVEVYGSVELSGAAMVRLSLPWMAPASGGFVGIPLPGYRVRIVDDQGRRVRPGEVGELQVRGPGLLRGYLGRGGGGAIVEGGWLRTGDLASRTWLGMVRFVGRDKDVIKSGGYSVFPAEIETRLQEHPAVEIAAVVGVPHPTLGAVPAAAVVLSEGRGEAELEGVTRWIGERVASYKAPRAIVAMVREELPYGPTGKIKKRLLSEVLSDRLRQVDEAGDRG